MGRVLRRFPTLGPVEAAYARAVRGIVEASSVTPKNGEVLVIKVRADTPDEAALQYAGSFRVWMNANGLEGCFIALVKEGQGGLETLDVEGMRGHGWVRVPSERELRGYA